MSTNYLKPANHQLLIFALVMFASRAFAGPPFMTDDPVPVDYKHSEFYVFSTYDKASDGNTAAFPAFEYNYGVMPESQIHIVVPFVHDAPNGAAREYGLGDVEVGVKYRFIQESNRFPQIGIFPMVELDTGDADKGLGNGKTWYRLPIWLQKGWGDWVTYGGGGYAINHADGQKDYPFVGWLVQREIGERWTLGGEIFGQGKTTDDGEATTFLNFGGYYKFSADFNLLFSAGHDVAGERHTIAYLGLWWTWSGVEKAEPKSGRAPQNRWSLSQRSENNVMLFRDHQSSHH